MVEPNSGKKSGIFYEVLERAARKLNLSVDWVEEVGFGEMAEGLDNKRFDVVGSGVWINSSRGTVADFTMPVLYDVVCAFSRVDDHRFDQSLSVANSKNIRISTIDGEMAASIAKADFPNAEDLSLPQNSDFTLMIQNVINKKADLTFLGLAAARRFESANPNTIRNITPTQPLRIFPTAIMTPVGEYEFTRELNIALGEMLYSGEIESIIRQFEELPGSHFRVSPGYASPKP